uniref:Metallo-beta-lactamase domain-containing protein n=1 Tax=Tetradesmus obliquus TaxID=3088 RepID=A0A383WLF3_TETOB
MEGLVKLDKLHLLVIVDNESDGLSQPCGAADPSAKATERAAMYQSEVSHNVLDVRTGRAGCLDFQKVAFAGHGLSVLLTAEVDGKSRTLLFDGGPSPGLFRHNVEALGVDVADIEAAVLSHWHIDHSVGLIEAASMISEARAAAAAAAADASGSSDSAAGGGTAASDAAGGASAAPVIFDLHPKRPQRRGLQFPNGEVVPFNNEPELQQLQQPGIEEPELQQLQQPGIEVQLHEQGHCLLDGAFYVSGGIPRNTSYEAGNPMHASQWEPDGAWQADELVADERYLAARVKGRGTVVLSACSHAGIVNVMRDVQAKTGQAPYAVFGGFHLSPKDTAARIQPTVADIVAMQPQLVVAGHCTGWQAKAALAAALKERYMPSFVGARFSFPAAPDA